MLLLVIICSYYVCILVYDTFNSDAPFHVSSLFSKSRLLYFDKKWERTLRFFGGFVLFFLVPVRFILIVEGDTTFGSCWSDEDDNDVALDACDFLIFVGDREDGINDRDRDEDDDDNDDDVVCDACDFLMCLHVLRPLLSTPPVPHVNDVNLFPFRDT